MECYDWLSNFKHLIGRYNEYVNPHINLQPAHKPCDFFIGKCPFTSANWTLVKLYLGQKEVNTGIMRVYETHVAKTVVPSILTLTLTYIR